MTSPVPTPIVVARRLAGAILVLALVTVLVGVALLVNAWVTRPVPIGVTASVTSPTSSETQARTSPSPRTKNTAASAQFTCWDSKTVVDSVDSCSMPNGEDGLKYLFPSLQENLDGATYDCSYVKYPKREEDTFSYDCPLSGQTLEDADQLVRYRYWTDAKVSLTHYESVFKNGSSTDFILDGKKVGKVYANHEPIEYGRYVIAFVMLRGHMCLSIEGSDEDLLNKMVPEARFRAAKQIYGYAGTSPTEGRWDR